MTKFKQKKNLSDLFKKQKRVNWFVNLPNDLYEKAEEVRSSISQQEGRKVSQSELTEVALERFLSNYIGE